MQYQQGTGFASYTFTFKPTAKMSLKKPVATSDVGRSLENVVGKFRECGPRFLVEVKGHIYLEVSL